MVRSTTSKRLHFRATHFVGLLAALVALLSGQHFATAQTIPGDTALAQTPLFVSDSYPPLNMLVMGRDHKLYYEAYNDASDLDGDGVIDVGYKPDKIDYYGYFNNNACYSYSDDKFNPSAVATGSKKKQCDGTKWSGDFLNYLTTSRMDAMRRVLYGGMRVNDTKTSTVLQAAFIPRDAHSWGKSYDPARDIATYDISKYAPLAQPVASTRHLFAVTTTAQSGDGAIPRLRVLNDSKFQIWEWVSKEQPVAQGNCIDNSTSCERATATDEFTMLPSSAFQDLTIRTWKFNGAIPGTAADMNSRFTTYSTTANLCGSAAVSVINAPGTNNNPFSGTNGCTHDNYLTQIDGKVYIPAAGNYVFAIDGDDAVELVLGSSTLGWYGGHGNNRSQDGLQSHSTTINFSTPGWKTLRFRHVEGGGDDNWGLALKASYPKSTIVDQKIRVEACASTNADLRDATCKPYPNEGGTTIYKPTGLLHDFGENEKMYFGLLTGSYQKNIAGGTLRRNMSKFTDEVNLQTGQFKSDVNGVVANIDRQQAIGFNGSSYANCPHITDGPISGKTDPSICAMWGNPIGEMMFETMRYFAGAADAHPEFKYGTGSKDAGLSLSAPAWVAPYKSKAENGGGYQHCARPVMTVLSDINPSYDFKLPGSQYKSITASADVLNGFNVSTEVKAIGSAEGIHGKNFFIGQSTSSNADTAPSVKKVDDLSWVRGLSPQEPSKEGTYNSAGVSRFAANNAIFGNAKGKNRLMTYAVAIASPLPEIRFPVSTTGNYVTIAPFAKSVTGNSIDPTKFAPTNQIVDYYVDRIANTGTADQNLLINGGRPYAEFRINYEDVEQGADHDMDAISRYIVALTPEGTVKIDMASEYAAGGIGQHMGYVISGTSQDGMYLEVRDKDTASVYYALNTPPGQAPGYCVGKSGEAACQNLPLTASRTFTPSVTNTSGSFLKDPLWYAAKYGMPGRDPATVAGDPDNYFLVTNATTLKEKMTKAFNDILQNNNSITAVSVTVPEGTIAAGADIYRTRFEAEGWVGDVIRERLTENTTGLNYVRQWSASEKLAARATPRKILYAASGTATPTLRPFTFAGISAQPDDATWLTALNLDPSRSDNYNDGKAAQRIAFLRGESQTLRTRKKLTSGQPIVLGDIVNSSPVRVAGAIYRSTAADLLEGAGSNYATFSAGQASKPAMIYVGANDGMLHAFRADTGEEEFAYIPSALRNSLNVLTAADYGAKDGTPHRYFVDGTPVVSDVFIGGAWRKVLIGSLGAGGRQIFALDITDPAAPKLLWEFGSGQNSAMGNSLAQPTIARLNDPTTGKGKWVALVPNGYQGGTSSTGGANLFVLDIANGNVLKQFDLDSGMTPAEITASQPLGNGLSRALGLDGNRDGKVDMAYAGDLAGNMWRFDLRGGDSSAWKAQKLYTARDAGGTRQPITASPYVVDHPMGRGDLIIFGTGRLLTVSDKVNAQRQAIYGIWDRYSSEGTTPNPLPTADKGRANLQSQTFTELATGSGNFGLSNNLVRWFKTSATGTADADVDKWGWVVDLPRDGEKMTYDMTLYGRGLFLSTVRTSDDPCAAGLSGTLYAMDPTAGGKTDYVPFDMNGDGSFNATDAINGNTVSGTQTGAGRQTIRAGRVFDPNANAERRVNSGMEFGRQNWRRQPPNGP